MKKTIYILTLLCFLAATFAMFCCVGCESQTSVRPTLLVFSWRDHCSECRQQEPIVAEIEQTGFFNVVKFDYDHDPEAFKAYHIDVMPTYVIICRGQEVFRGIDARRILISVRSTPGAQ